MFLVDWGVVTGRLDPSYYLDRQEARELVKLGQLVGIRGGKRIPKGLSFSAEPTKYRYVRVENIRDFEVDKENANYLSPALFEQLKRYELRNGEVVISIAGTVGRTAVFHNDSDERFILTENCAKFVGLSPNLDAAYLKYVLSLGFVKRQIEKSSIQTTIPKLGLSRLLDLAVPCPPLEIQKHAVGVLDHAYTLKKQKEQEASSLLDDISRYLLEALEIALPSQNGDIRGERRFFVRSVEVLGGRFDPRQYSQKYQRISAAIERSPFAKIRLREALAADTAGSWGFDKTESRPDYTACLTIRATEFDNRYNLNLDNSRVKYRWYPPQMLDRITLRGNDILVEKSGGSDDQPVGRVALITEEMAARQTLSYSNFIHKLTIRPEMALPAYVFEYLRLMHHIGFTEVMQTQTNGIRNLMMDEYLRQTLLLPSLEKQRAMADKTNDMRQKAKALERQASDAVRDARAEVERILSANDGQG